MLHTTESIIDKIKPILGVQYDYSRVEWRNWSSPLIIVCSKHGEFSMFPGEISSPSSRRKKSCPGCAREAKAQDVAGSLLLRFRAVHGDKYDYSLVRYENMRTKVTVVCPQHGEFWPTPVNHLHGHGCPGCFSSGPSSQETKWLDALEKGLGKPIARSVAVAGYRVVADGVFDDVAIEFDGSYWHGRLGTLARDIVKTQRLIDAGYRVVRLRGHQERLALLQDVPKACNIHVSDKVNDADLRSALDLITKEILP